ADNIDGIVSRRNCAGDMCAVAVVILRRTAKGRKRGAAERQKVGMVEIDACIHDGNTDSCARVGVRSGADATNTLGQLLPAAATTTPTGGLADDRHLPVGRYA